MKKIIVAGLLSTLGSISFAASTPVPLVAGPNTVSIAACTLLSEPVTVTLSKANLGNVNCNDTTAAIGVAVANTSGKFKVFSLGSGGGQLTETTTTVAPVASDVASAASLKAGGS